MKLNGDSIYGSGNAGLDKPEWGSYTRKGNKLYAHVFEPSIGPLLLPGIPADKVKKLRLLSDRSELKISSAWMIHAYNGRLFAETDALMHDCMLPDPVDTVIEVELAE